MSEDRLRRLQLIQKQAQARERIRAESAPTFWDKAYENVVGRGEVDTPGERLGATLNDMGRAFGSGVARGATQLVDLPSAALSGMSNAAVSGMERSGMIGSQLADATRDVLEFGPTRTGVAQDAAQALAPEVMSYEPKTTAGDYAQNVGEFTPGAMTMGLAAVPLYGFVPGVVSEAFGQATEGKQVPDIIPLVGGTDAEPWARMFGALAGPVAVNAARRVVTPNPADPGRTAQAQFLDDEGVRLTAGQRTGNTALRYREEMAGRTQEIFEQQGDDFTRAALRYVGIDADRAEPEVMRAAFDRIGTVFDDLAARNTIQPDRRLANQAQQALRTYQNNTNRSNVAPLIGNVTAKVRNAVASGEPITGRQYQQWRSELGTALRSNDSQLRDAAGSLRSVLDDALERTMREAGNTGDLALYGTARRQYRDLLAIETAVSKAGQETALGVINPRQLRMAVVQQGKRGYATGTRSLGDLARAGNATMQRPPQSGTQPRQAVHDLLSGGAPTGGVAGLGAYAITGDPMIAAGAGALTAAAPMARNAFTGSSLGQAYLANQLIANQGPLVGREATATMTNALAQYLAQNENR